MTHSDQISLKKKAKIEARLLSLFDKYYCKCALLDSAQGKVGRKDRVLNMVVADLSARLVASRARTIRAAEMERAVKRALAVVIREEYTTGGAE